MDYGLTYKFFFRRDKDFTEIRKPGFAEQASAYFKDTPNLSEMIRLGNLGYDDLVTILQLYAKEISQ